MAKSNWKDLAVGDFFVTNNYDNDGQGYSLYQKIDPKARPYNSVLLNSGLVCCVHESESKIFQRVEVALEVKPQQ